MYTAWSKELDLGLEAKAAETLGKYAQNYNTVAPLAVKNNIFVMEKANGVQFDKFAEYLEKNNNWPKTIKVALNNTDSYYRPYSFWNFVSKLQLAFNNEKYDSLLDLSSSQETVLNQLGWGNIFSLEKLCTIEKYGNDFTSTFDKDIYKKILNASKKISRIKNIVDAFNPNYIILLAWQEVEKWLFRDLEYDFNRSESKKNLLSVYNIKKSSTKILWTYHPRALCWKNQKPDELIKLLEGDL